MKKTRGLLVACGVIVLLLAACNKNQRTVRNLEGKWKVTSFVENGFEWIVNDSSIVEYQWNSCKIKKGDCSGNYSVNYIGFLQAASDFTYSISEKGTKLKIDFVDTSFVDIADATITTHTDEEFAYNGTYTDGATVQVVMKKQ